MIEAFILRISLKYMKAMQISRFWNLKMIFQTTQFLSATQKRQRETSPTETKRGRKFEKSIITMIIDQRNKLKKKNWCFRSYNCCELLRESYEMLLGSYNCCKLLPDTLTVITVATLTITIIIANIIIGNLFSVELRISFKKAMQNQFTSVISITITKKMYKKLYF